MVALACRCFTLGIELKQLRYRLERDLDLVSSPRLQPDAIVFLFPSELRERHARPKLDIHIGIRVATSAKDIFYSNPLGSEWLPIGRDQRFPLVQLQERATL